jgi:hypothetical protein
MRTLPTYIFIGACILSALFLGIRWSELDFKDADVWAEQVHLIQTTPPENFHTLDAYGHPGGPIIEGAIAFQKLLGVSAFHAVLIFMTLIHSFLIASICSLCYVLRKNMLWVIAVFGMLSLHRLYYYTTPPSALASLLFVFLALLTLYICEKKTLQPKLLVLWGVVLGILVATRIDTGIIAGVFFLAVLIYSFGLKKVWIPLLSSFATFVIGNPFMWFAPIQHISYLISYLIDHHADYKIAKIPLLILFDINILTLVSVFFATIFLISPKKLESPLPRIFIVYFLLVSTGIYAIILTADYQAPRYLQPVIFLWEILLPLFLFNLIARVDFEFLYSQVNKEKGRYIARIGIVCVLVGYHAAIFIYLLSLAP